MTRRLSTFVAAIACLLLTTPTAHAGAGTDPLHDSNASGALAFCNEAGATVTRGSVDARPFVWRAVATTPAPSGDADAKATLMAYQPRQGVDPGNWSGMPLTGSSVFTNPKHPMAAATYGDLSLSAFVQTYPPQWNRLVELRLTFTGGAGSDPASYPAAVVRVSGHDWTLVSGGGASCTSGRAVSAELMRLPSEHLDRPRTPAQRAARAAAFEAAATGISSSSAPRGVGGPSTPTPLAHRSSIPAVQAGPLADLALVGSTAAGASAIAIGAAWLVRRRRRMAG